MQINKQQKDNIKPKSNPVSDKKEFVLIDWFPSFLHSSSTNKSNENTSNARIYQPSDGINMLSSQ